MRDESAHPRIPEAGEPVPEVWRGRATNRLQWVPAAAGAACMALGVTLAVDAPWTSGTAPLLMAVIGCVAAGLLVLFGTLAFVHVEVRVDDRAMEVRCGHMGLPRRRIPLSHVIGADFVPKVTPASGAAGATAGGPRRGRRWSSAGERPCRSGSATAVPSP